MSTKTDRPKSNNSIIHVSKLKSEISDLTEAITNQKAIKWTFLKTNVDEYFDQLRLETKRNRSSLSRSQSFRPDSQEEILRRRISSARDLGNVFSVKNRSAMPSSRSQSTDAWQTKQLLIHKGRAYGQLMSNQNLQRLKSINRCAVGQPAAVDYDAGWLEKFQNPNDTHNYGKYYNNVQKILTMENEIGPLMERYGRTEFINNYLDLIRECYTFERHNDKVLRFGHHRMVTIERHFLRKIRQKFSYGTDMSQTDGKSDESISLVDGKILHAIDEVANESGFLPNYSEDKFTEYLKKDELSNEAAVDIEAEQKQYCDKIAAELIQRSLDDVVNSVDNASTTSGRSSKIAAEVLTDKKGETITGNRLLVDKESERIVENKTNELTTRNDRKKNPNATGPITDDKNVAELNVTSRPAENISKPETLSTSCGFFFGSEKPTKNEIINTSIQDQKRNSQQVENYSKQAAESAYAELIETILGQDYHYNKPPKKLTLITEISVDSAISGYPKPEILLKHEKIDQIMRSLETIRKNVERTIDNSAKAAEHGNITGPIIGDVIIRNSTAAAEFRSNRKTKTSQKQNRKQLRASDPRRVALDKSIINSALMTELDLRRKESKDIVPMSLEGIINFSSKQASNLESINWDTALRTYKKSDLIIVDDSTEKIVVDLVKSIFSSSASAADLDLERRMRLDRSNLIKKHTIHTVAEGRFSIAQNATKSVELPLLSKSDSENRKERMADAKIVATTIFGSIIDYLAKSAELNATQDISSTIQVKTAETDYLKTIAKLDKNNLKCNIIVTFEMEQLIVHSANEAELKVANNVILINQKIIAEVTRNIVTAEVRQLIDHSADVAAQNLQQKLVAKSKNIIAQQSKVIVVMAIQQIIDSSFTAELNAVEMMRYRKTESNEKETRDTVHMEVKQLINDSSNSAEYLQKHNLVAQQNTFSRRKITTKNLETKNNIKQIIERSAISNFLKPKFRSEPNRIAVVTVGRMINISFKSAVRKESKQAVARTVKRIIDCSAIIADSNSLEQHPKTFTAFVKETFDYSAKVIQNPVLRIVHSVINQLLAKIGQIRVFATDTSTSRQTKLLNTVEDAVLHAEFNEICPLEESNTPLDLYESFRRPFINEDADYDI